MPLNAACLEGKSKEFAFTGFNDVAFGCINHQLQAVTQESANTIEHTFTRTGRLYQYGKIIRISGKFVTPFLKLFVQWVEHDVCQKRR